MTLEIPLLTKLNEAYEKQKTERPTSKAANWQAGWVPFNGVTPWNASFWEVDNTFGAPIEAAPPTPLIDLIDIKAPESGLERAPSHDIFIRQDEPVVIPDPALQEERWVDDFLRYWF